MAAAGIEIGAEAGAAAEIELGEEPHDYPPEGLVNCVRLLLAP